MTKTQNSYSYYIDTKSINTPSLVIAELEKLGSLIPSSNLYRLESFNRAYHIVTKKIDEAKNQKIFSYPALMEELEVNFAKQYFNALNYYVKNSILPKPWDKVMEGRFNKTSPSWLSLLKGADAHINYDLPNSLKEVIDDPKKFSSDYFKLNTLLLDSAKLISKSHEKDLKPSIMKELGLRVFQRPTMWLIIKWRTKVWGEFMSQSQ